MTPDQHRRIGAILGYYPCCVEAWVASLDAPGPSMLMRNGAITLGVRTYAESCALWEKITVEVMNGAWCPRAAFTHDPRISFAVCDEHVGAPGWKPW